MNGKNATIALTFSNSVVHYEIIMSILATLFLAKARSVEVVEMDFSKDSPYEEQPQEKNKDDHLDEITSEQSAASDNLSNTETTTSIDYNSTPKRFKQSFREEWRSKYAWLVLKDAKSFSRLCQKTLALVCKQIIKRINFKKLKNALGELMYLNIRKFVGALLSFPHSSATTERVFFQTKLIKSPIRNKLKVSTVNSIMLIKNHFPNDNFFDWIPSKNISSKYNKKT